MPVPIPIRTPFVSPSGHLTPQAQAFLIALGGPAVTTTEDAALFGLSQHGALLSMAGHEEDSLRPPVLVEHADDFGPSLALLGDLQRRVEELEIAALCRMERDPMDLRVALNSIISQTADSLVVRPTMAAVELAMGRVGGFSYVNRFGRNPDVDAPGPEDIWNGGGIYTGFPTGSAETVQAFSDSANDTSAGTGARTLKIFGLDANYAEQSETITLNGVTPVASVGTYMRVNLAYVVTAGSGGVNVGTLTVRHSTTTANVFVSLPVGFGQTQIACYTIPAGHTGVLTRFGGQMLDNTTNDGQMVVWVREFGGASRLWNPFAIATGQPLEIVPIGGRLLPEKTDVAMRMNTITNSNANVTATFDIVLVKN